MENLNNRRTYDSIFLSRYIIDYLYKKENPITNLKLQILLYYIQIYFLTKERTLLFSDEIIKTKYSVRIPQSYSEFRINGSFEIEENFVNISDFIEKEDRIIINKILDKSIYYKAIDLIRKLRDDDPYILTKEIEDEITVEKLIEFYSINQHKLL